jgi:GGDEF domain-containing protein
MADLTREKSPVPTQSLVEANEQLVLALLQATAAAEKSAARLGEVMMTAHLDALTGLPDRTLFLDRFSQAIARARRHRARLALLFVDLDQFKDVNDTRGHAVGDRILRAVADALQATVRAADTVSRHGGDEFLVLLTEISSADGAQAVRCDHDLARDGGAGRAVDGQHRRLRLSGRWRRCEDADHPRRLGHVPREEDAQRGGLVLAPRRAAVGSGGGRRGGHRS